MSHTFSPLTVPATTVRQLHIGMGDGEATPTDPAMQFAGTAITPANFWNGSDNNYWDDDTINISAALLPAGTTSRTNSQGATGECLTWAYALLAYR